MPISLAFFTLKGDPFPELPMTLPGNSPKLINLNELFIKNGLNFQEGSLQIRYQYAGCLLVLSAGMIQRIPSMGIVFDELLARPSTFRSSQLEAVFPLSSYPKSIGLTLTNTSPLKVKASIRYDALAAQNFSTQTEWLKPHETKVFYVENLYAPRFQEKVGPAGGVSIQHDGKPGDVVARGFMANASSGYSASVDFVDPAMAATSTLQGGGLHLGPMGLVSLEPSLVVRNVGDTSSSVTVKVPYLYKDGSTGLASLPIFSLEPGEIRVIKEELIQTLKSLSLQSNSQSLGLEIDYSAKPGTVVAFAQSVSPDGEQIFQLPLVDPRTKGAAGDYPWFITDTSRPVVYLKNTTDKDQDYTVQIDFDGGGFVNGLKKIPAHQTAVIDIQELRDQEVKDERGKTIPMTATSGKVSWSVVGPDAHSMIGRIEQTDIAAGISYSFACSNCCPNSYYGSSMNPNPLILVMGGTVLEVPSEQDQNCYGGLLVPYVVSPSSWSSSAVNVVTVQAGTVNGVSPGNATVTAQWTVHNWSPYHGYCVDHQVIINNLVPAQVKPVINSISPALRMVGNSVDVIITGKGFGSNPFISVGGGISVSNITTNLNGTDINARFTIPANSQSGGDQSVVVSNQGVPSNSATFHVQIPAKMVRLNYPGAPNGVGPLMTPNDGNVIDLNYSLVRTHVCGVYRNYVFDIEELNGTSVHGSYNFVETLSNYSTTVSGLTIPPPKTTSISNGDGTMTDLQMFVVAAPSCLGSNDHESFDLSHSVTIGGQLFPLSTKIHMERGNYTNMLKVDSTITTP